MRTTIDLKLLDKQISTLSSVINTKGLPVKQLEKLDGIYELLCTIEDELREDEVSLIMLHKDEEK